MTVPRRFLLRAAGATVAEGVIFTDGAAVVYRRPDGEPSSNRHFDRFPVGTVVAGRLAAGEIPRAIVPLAGNAGDELTLEWLDDDPEETTPAGAFPARPAELAEPDLTAGAYE